MGSKVSPERNKQNEDQLTFPISNSEIKQDIFKDECKSIEQCSSINRIRKYLNQYQNDIIHFIQQHHPFLTNDFNHILLKHLSDYKLEKRRNEEFESIYDYIIQKIQPCDLEECRIYVRNNRDKETENISSFLDMEQITDKDLDHSCKYKLEIMDTMHCFLVHSFDSGFRIRSDQFTSNQPDISNPDDDELLCIDETMIKLYSYLKTKKGGIQNIRATKRASNSNDGKTNSYSFGHEYQYWSSDSDDYIKPKYSNLKKEILNNAICTVKKHVFDEIMYKAQNKLLTHYCKSLVIKRWNHYVDIGTVISLQHIMAVLLYTDLNELSYHFCSTFRSLSAKSTLKDDMKRNSQYANWSKLLAETVRYFGTMIGKSQIDVYYHPINCKLIVSSFSNKFMGPTSTTVQLSLAALFATDKGLILELQKASNKLTYFNCTWLSTYCHEDERLFLCPHWDSEQLIINNIRDIGAMQNYQRFMHPLISMADILSRLSSDYQEWEEGKYDAVILKEFFKHFDPRNEYKNSFPDYINNIFAAFANTVQAIYPSQPDIKLKYPSLTDLFFDENNIFKYGDVCNIFTKLSSISVGYQRYPSIVFYDEQQFNALYEQIKILNKSGSALKQIKIDHVKTFNPEIYDECKSKLKRLGYKLSCKQRRKTDRQFYEDILIEKEQKSLFSVIKKEEIRWEQQYSIFNQQKRNKLEMLIYSWIRDANIRWNERKYFTFDIINSMIDYYTLGKGWSTFPNVQLYKANDGDIYWINDNKDGKLPADDSKIDIEYTGYCCQDKNGKNLFVNGNEKQFTQCREIIQLNDELKVISGLRDAVKEINEGSTVKIWIASKHAYGAKGCGKLVPPNCDLLFEATIHRVFKEAEKKEEWKWYEKRIVDREPINWTDTLLNVIEHNETTLNMDDLTVEEAQNIPWDLLLKCTSVSQLSIAGYPSNEYYQPYHNVYEWSIKPPGDIMEEMENLFPWQIFEMENLKKLVISGYPYSFLSEKLGNLRNLQTLIITGSRILYLPAAIGKLKALQKLDFYTSRRLRYVPYEILNCSLTSTKMSTSQLYTNSKNNMLLPPLPQTIKNFTDRFYLLFLNEYGLSNDLTNIIIDYLPFVICSNLNCENKIFFKECIYYGWSRQCPGTDVVCLLAKMCSKQCIDTIQNGTRYFLGNVKSNHNENRYYQNCICVEGEVTKNYIDKTPIRNIDDEMERFEYFWRYNLGINFNTYKLVHEHHQEITVVFD